jgi:hypothetical protein
MNAMPWRSQGLRIGAPERPPTAHLEQNVVAASLRLDADAMSAIM